MLLIKGLIVPTRLCILSIAHYYLSQYFVLKKINKFGVFVVAYQMFYFTFTNCAQLVKLIYGHTAQYNVKIKICCYNQY